MPDIYHSYTFQLTIVHTDMCTICSNKEYKIADNGGKGFNKLNTSEVYAIINVSLKLPNWMATCAIKNVNFIPQT